MDSKLVIKTRLIKNRFNNSKIYKHALIEITHQD